MGSEGLVTLTLVDQASLLVESRQDSHLHAVGIHNGTSRLAEHVLAGEVNLLDRAVVEFAQLAVKNHLNVFSTVCAVDLCQFSFKLSVFSTSSLNVGG